MGLNYNNAKKAIDIINNVFCVTDCHTMDYDDYEETPILNKVILYDIKMNDIQYGVEGVYINVKNITGEQLIKFHNQRNSVKNSSYIETPDSENITKLGFY